MKKTLSIFLVMLLAFSLTACSQNKLADIYVEEDVITSAKEIVELVNAQDFDGVNAAMRADLQESLTGQQLEDALAPLLTQAGAFQEYSTVTAVGQKSKSTNEDYATVVLVCKHENGNLIFTITLDANLDLVGIYCK